MEKFMQRVFMTLGALLMLLFVALLGKMCYDLYLNDDYSNAYSDCQTQYDGHTPKTIVFTTANEAVITHAYMINETTANDVFLDMPPEAVQTVANVLITSRGSCTIADIAAEYRANRLIYSMSNNKINIPLPVDTGIPLKPDERKRIDTISPPNVKLQAL